MKSQTTEIYEILRDKILSGEFRPMQRLTEAKLVKELGVSRNHVRMAFQRLVGDGLIDLEPNQGAVVSDVTLDDILDIFVVREALELEAYRRAFVRMDDIKLARFELLIQKMRNAIADNDYEVYSSSASDFRKAILDIAESPRLRESADSLLMITARVVLRKIMIPLRGNYSLAEHEQIINALAGDSIEAVEIAFRTHITNVKADIEQYWDIVKP